LDESPQKPWGGKRAGAGRKPRNAAALTDIDLAAVLDEPSPVDIRSLAQRHVSLAIGALVKQLKFGESDTATIAAANEILDRGYGKPAVDVGGVEQLPLFGGVSLKPISTEIRDEARKYAPLAIERLRKVADGSRSETARVSASRSLLARGLGLVAPAKIDLETPRALGKKEQATLDAATIAAGGDADWGDDLSPRLH
jgi:hypothetical protein